MMSRQADDDLEYLIDTQALILATRESTSERRAAWDELQRLVRLRSDARVAEMEKARGLR